MNDAPFEMITPEEMMHPYTEWRRGMDPNRVGDPPRLRYTNPTPRTRFGEPWCDACDEGFPAECYCTGCKGADSARRGKHGGCYCWLGRQMAGIPA